MDAQAWSGRPNAPTNRRRSRHTRNSRGSNRTSAANTAGSVQDNFGRDLTPQHSKTQINRTDTTPILPYPPATTLTNCPTPVAGIDILPMRWDRPPQAERPFGLDTSHARRLIAGDNAPLFWCGK